MIRQPVAKSLLWLFWAANITIIVGFWFENSGQYMLAGQLSPLLAFGRLTGLLATFAALTQFVLMGREGWLEPVFGLDRITRFHRINGYTAISLMLLHPILLWAAYNIGSPITINLLGFPYVPLAAVSLVLFLTIVSFTVYIVRRHLTFEMWYYVHLFTYLAIVLLPFHQLTLGGDLQSQLFANYWIALYIFAAANLLIWRFGRPVYLFIKHKFTIQTVASEAPRATSVYITGRNMESFKAKGGQFVLVRFLTKELWWQEHPFSLSRLPNGDGIRLTIRQLGDFTNEIPKLKPGTKVVISGPHGAFTHQQAVTDKKLYIAGGVGITPIRSMIEEDARIGRKDAILLYGNHSSAEIIFNDELDQLKTLLHMPVHHVLGDEPAWPGEKGYIDKEKISRLAPDVLQRDIFLCGPPPMMAGVVKALQEIGVPRAQIHYEFFNLHVKRESLRN